MPCRVDDFGTTDTERYRDEANKVTRMLCTMCEVYEKAGFAIPGSIVGWWEKHQEVDRKRREAEEKERLRKLLKKNALNKLTSEERKALGL